MTVQVGFQRVNELSQIRPVVALVCDIDGEDNLAAALALDDVEIEVVLLQQLGEAGDVLLAHLELQKKKNVEGKNYWLDYTKRRGEEINPSSEPFEPLSNSEPKYLILKKVETQYKYV